MVLAWLVTLGLAQVFGHGVRPPRPATIVESIALFALYAGLLAYAPVREWVWAIPSPHRAVLAGFVFLATFGQLALKSRGTFPFTAWTMYARPEIQTRLDYYRYRGTDANGREVAVDPAKVWTFVNSAEIASRVKAIGRVAIAETESPARDEARARVRDLLGALMTSYNREHPEAPLRSLEFMHYGWDYRRHPPETVRPTAVLRLDAPGSDTP
jgi:hypothetical protein